MEEEKPKEKGGVIPLGIYILKRQKGGKMSLVATRKRLYQDKDGNPLPCSSESEYSYLLNH